MSTGLFMCMVTRWRVEMYLQYRRLVAAPFLAAEEAA